MKIIKSLKNWYRGKPAPPLKLFVGLNPLTRTQIEVEQKDKYVQPLLVRIVAINLKILKDIIKFTRREWRTVIPITIALFSFAVALLALLANDKFMKLISR